MSRLAEKFKESLTDNLKSLRRHWIGTAVIILATTIFFWPLILNIANYSEGGDAMFNAWTLARDQHCILRQDCPSYSDANIYFPHHDTMLYSETQLSAGLLTLPLYFINQNPIFSYNILTILSFFFSGWFMYLLAKRLSKGNEVYSILAGLAFEFAPIKMSAISHLQNLSIFYLPLIVLLILKYIDKPSRKYLAWLFVVLILQFYASWYQMVFVLTALVMLLGGMLLSRLMTQRTFLRLSLVIFVAIIATLPLAKEYIRFSKYSQATFNITDQAKYSSSLADYVIPNSGTILGKAYYEARPNAQINSYNPDSYSYHSIILYIVAAAVLLVAWRQRKTGKLGRQRFYFVLVLVALGIVAFVMSLGPLLKLQGSHIYNAGEVGLQAVIPLPYVLIDILLPQLSFIRAIGRVSVLMLFVLCCLLALSPVYWEKLKFYKHHRVKIIAAIIALMIIELMPIHHNPMTTEKYFYEFNIPRVYRFIKGDPSINRLVILTADPDYPRAAIPVARAEQIMWSGYHNKQIFNGYSGYTPSSYFHDLADFTDFKADDVPKMKHQHLRYVMVDKRLSTSNPNLVKRVARATTSKVYEDDRYALFKL